MQKAAPAFVAGAAILWGILVIFVKQLDRAGLAIYNRSLLRIKWKDCWCFTGTGIVSIVFFSYCYFKNVTVSSVAVSSILMYTSPVWVTVISRFVF